MTVPRDAVILTIPQVVDDETYQYVYGIGRISQAGSSVTYYYLSDGLGSTMALTDESGDVVNTYDYDVFGGVRGMTGSQPNDFTFAGEQVDGSTGLQYLRARYYDVETGIFISKDPMAVRPSWNEHPFGYAGGNPVQFVDPTGSVPTPPIECEFQRIDGQPNTCGNPGGPPRYEEDCDDIGRVLLKTLVNQVSRFCSGIAGRADNRLDNVLVNCGIAGVLALPWGPWASAGNCILGAVGGEIAHAIGY
jgi:RHS repeat-associated protein